MGSFGLWHPDLKCDIEVEGCKSPGSGAWGQLRLSACWTYTPLQVRAVKEVWHEQLRVEITNPVGYLSNFWWWKMPREMSEVQFCHVAQKGLNKNQNIVHVHFLKHIACTTTSFIVSNAYEIFQEKQTNKKSGHFQKSFYQQTEGITQISQGVSVYVCICVCAVCFLSNLLSTWWVYAEDSIENTVVSGHLNEWFLFYGISFLFFLLSQLLITCRWDVWDEYSQNHLHM